MAAQMPKPRATRGVEVAHCLELFTSNVESNSFSYISFYEYFIKPEFGGKGEI